MKRSVTLLLLVLWLPAQAAAQVTKSGSQLAVWSGVSHQQSAVWFGGMQVLPALRYNHQLGQLQIAAEASLHLQLYEKFIPLDNAPYANVAPYRCWLRFADSTKSIRIGLQQINFGSATIFRPLMWFDNVNPIDPLGFTVGTWSVLGQFYFKQTSNLWVWVVAPSENLHFWELLPTKQKTPEVGGRWQFVVPKGEIGLAGSLKRASLGLTASGGSISAETLLYKFGADGKWDIGPGVWWEFAFSATAKPTEALACNALLTLGADYTFALGNGLNLLAEHLWAVAGTKPSDLSHKLQFTALALSYPIDFFNHLRAITYFDWKNEKAYSFIQYEQNLSKGKFVWMAWANPANTFIPGRTSDNLFGGKGIQCTYVLQF